jgi:tRNA (guanine37-N1)-methyltransferase
MKNKPRAFDILGNIAIVKFPNKFKLKDKKKFAEKILRENKSIRTILEKQGKVKGRLRKIQTKHLAGEKTKEVLYKENNCVFRFNIDSTYFSPRLSNERKEIASKIKKNDKVLVMFSGVAPYSIVIAKNSKANVVSIEINREANKYAKLNIELNKFKDSVEIIQGDIKKLAEGLKKRKFDVIVMPRPQLKDSFLREAFMLSKKNTKIFYYDFCKEDEINSIVEKIKSEAKKYKKKIKILKTKTAGEIAPYKTRVRIDFKIL